LLDFILRGVAQPGSAPALGAGGPRFESGHPDHHLFIRRHGGFFLPFGKCRLSASGLASAGAEHLKRWHRHLLLVTEQMF
jgi:hypothetical protein